MPISLPFIRTTLARFEGNGITRGYVPCDKAGVPLGASGVTIGTGVDLGQQTGAGLLDMGVPDELVRKLVPYIGLKRVAAQDALKRQPLILTTAEVTALDDAVIGRYVRDIANRYNRDNPATSFADIPREAQAVIVSLLYQRGLNSPHNFHNTWESLVDGDWPDAAARLCNGKIWDGYQTRRRSEGLILRQIKAAPTGDTKK